MIIIKKIKVKNFFSVGNSPIEIEYDKFNKTCVVGINGSSKSSVIIDSLIYALYGKPYRKANIPTIINSVNKSKLEVELLFSVDGKEYKIIRGQKPTRFEIYCNGELLNQDASNKDYQQYLENNILRVSYKSFTNVVILGSARYKPFMQMPAADRREIIEDLLDIQVFSVMNELAKSKLSTLKINLSELDYSTSLLKEKIILQKKHIKEQNKSIKTQLNESQSQIDKYNEENAKLEKDIFLIQKHVDVLNNKISDRTKLQSKEQKLISMESKMESALKKLKKDMDFYKTNDTCPTCYQGIDQEFKETRLEKAELKQNEFADGFVKLEESIADIKNKLEVMDTIYNDVIKHQNEIIRLNSVLTTNKNHVIMIQNSMANVKENSTSVGNLQQLDDELEDLTGQINRLNEEKEYLDTALTYLKDSGIKAKIIKKYVPLLNATINKYLQKLKLYFTFQIDENFKEKLKARHRDEFSYENMSEGEKLRLDLAILFSFREISKIKNSVNCNILIMDEIMDSSLDDMGQVELIDILSEFINQNIFIISHKTDNILDSFERVLEFEKKGNFAKLCEVVL